MGEVDDGSSASWRPLLVAAIDFGTAFSGYAFSFYHDYKKEPTKVSTFHWTGTCSLMSLKTSTCILFDENRKFHSFGYDAEDTYSELAEEEDGGHEKYYYFRRFKMELFDKMRVSKEFTLKDATGKEMPALEVFSCVIRYLSSHLFEKVKNSCTDATKTDIRRVLTVPAIWNDAAKQFMRAAAESAGIDGNKLLIALEPEAASIFCKHLPIGQFSGMTMEFSPFKTGSRYLVLDAGGGTVDITVHEVSMDNHIKELYKASGGDWGGTFVDTAFESFLCELIGSDVMTAFKTQHYGEYLDVFREFEVRKRDTKAEMRNKLALRLTSVIPDMYTEMKGRSLKGDIKQHCKYGVDDNVAILGDKLRVDKNTFTSFFEGALTSIGNHLEDLFKKTECNGVDTILMVGSFSNSPLLQEYIRRKFSDKQVISPEDADMVVLKGAVSFGHDPSLISERKCRYTYGCEIYDTWNESKHDPSRKVLSSDGTPSCKEVFSIHVRKGQTVKYGEPQVDKEYTPFNMVNDSRMIFQMYASTQENPMYITDMSCTHLGSLTIALPNGNTKHERAVRLQLKFGATELMATATVVKTGKTHEEKFNFLG